MKTSVKVIIRGLLLIFCVFALGACKPKESASQIDADKAAIRKFVDQGLTMVRGVNKDNAAEFVKFFYTEDAVIFPPNASPLKGYEELTKLLQNYPPMTDYVQEPKEIVVFGDYAYLWETWSVTMVLPGIAPYKDTGTIFWIMKKQNDKSWKCLREIWHSDLPIPTSSATSTP